MKNVIDGKALKELLASGASNLSNLQQKVDSLNVFPVPDGDTGTNMSLTFTSGVNDCLRADSDHVGDLAKVLSKGLLMGARGNSGVILSQIFRGFYQGVTECKDLDVKTFAYAWQNGAKIAYKAVMRPVEGTILTVIRESSDAGVEYIENNPEASLLDFMQNFYDFALKSLENTPNLLPVLKEVGVVDSGGYGLCVIFEGILRAIEGNPIETSLDQTASYTSSVSSIENEEYGYCTEFIISLNDVSVRSFKENNLKEKLGEIGESIVVVQDEDIVKVHVHTLKPGDALNLAQKYGEFIKLKIENMQVQHEEIIHAKPEEVKSEKQKYAIIAVASGDGVEQAFKELGVSHIITGGQTMNPATEDFVSVINKANAENIIILPNNSNIILAANQAALAIDDLKIQVLETKTIPQGLSACIVFNPDASLEDNMAEMEQAISVTSSASVTYAIKDTSFNGLAINEHDYIGIYEKDIIISNPNKLYVAQEILKKLVTNSSTILTVIVGEDVSEEEKATLIDFIDKELSIEYELIIGNQPVYSFIFGVE